MTAEQLAHQTASALMRALTNVGIESISVDDGIAYLEVHWENNVFELRIEEVTV